MLLIFLFSVVGMYTFATVKFDGLAHTSQTNFRTFPHSILALVRCMTGETWNDLMHSLSLDMYHFRSLLNTNCVAEMDITRDNWQALKDAGRIDNPDQCGLGAGAYIFFISYTVTVMWIVLNLFIAVVLEGFDDARGDGESLAIRLAIKLWNNYDPELKLWIPLEDAVRYINEVIHTYNYHINQPHRTVYKTLEDYGRVLVDGFFFVWTCQLCRRGKAEETQNEDEKWAQEQVKNMLDRVSLRHARACKLKCSLDGRVSFRAAVGAILRSVVTNMEASIADELDRLEETDTFYRMAKASSTGKGALYRQDSEITLEQHLAAVKLQKIFKAKIIAQRKRAERDSQVPEIAAGPPESGGGEKGYGDVLKCDHTKWL